MSKNNLKEFAVLMNTLADEFDKNNELSKEKVQRWKEMLLDQYGIDVLKEAVIKIIKTRKYSGFPKISEIIEAIEGSDEELRERALLVYWDVKKEMTKQGPYRSVTFDDLIINKTLSTMDTWDRLCYTPNDKWHWREKEFVEAYCIFKKKWDKNELYDIPKFLPGLSALSPSNLKHGYEPKVVKIKTRYPTVMSEEKMKRLGIPKYLLGSEVLDCRNFKENPDIEIEIIKSRYPTRSDNYKRTESVLKELNRRLKAKENNTTSSEEIKSNEP